MRATAGMLLVGLLAWAGGGCSSSRWGLAKSDPPKPANDEVRVKYGNPWAKPNDKVAADSEEKTKKLAAELQAAQLAQSKTRGSDLAENLKLAADAEQKGDFATAKIQYQKVLDLDPRHGEAHHRLAVIADQQRDIPTADAHYRQALAANRRDADLLSDLGFSYFLRGNFEESERYLKEALEINNYHRNSCAHLGQLYAKQGKYDAALAMFRQVSNENDAQRMIAQAFPNGRPGAGSPALPIATDQRSTPSFAGPADPRAPQNKNLPEWANGPAQPASNGVQQTNNAVAATPQAATLEQIKEALHPSASPATPANNFPPSNSSPQTVAMVPTNAPVNPAATFNNGPMSQGPTTNGPLPPQNAPNYWGGRMANNPNPPSMTSSSAPPPFDTSRNLAPQWPQSPPGNSAWNNVPAPAAPNTAAPASPWNGPDFQPAPVDPNPWSGFAPAASTNEMSTSDAARLAAQMAMNTGPGVMFPVVTGGPPSQNIMQTAGSNTGANGVRWAYAEQPQGANAPVQNAVQWNDRPQAASNDVQQGSWQNDLAPPSPWGDWQPPAPQSTNWMTPQNTAPPGMNQSNAGPPDSPPPWSNGPAAQTGPIVSPGPSMNPDSRYSSGAMPAGNTNAAPPMNSGSNGTTTTIPNWPYSPGR